METRELTIRVTPEAANVYTTASEKRRQVLDAFLSVWLRRLGKPTRPFEEVWTEVSEKAQANGLTPETLESILNEA